jgi:hypothetical protein
MALVFHGTGLIALFTLLFWIQSGERYETHFKPVYFFRCLSYALNMAVIDRKYICENVLSCYYRTGKNPVGSSLITSTILLYWNIVFHGCIFGYSLILLVFILNLQVFQPYAGV